MVFACQKDSFIKQFESVVVSCKESALSNGTNVKGYDVILEDTILFPEGGGQPCDFGFIDDVRVENIRRVSDKAVHFLENPVEEGKSVSVMIDWGRRFDHMQQHSGQHLITAVADKEFGYSTTSWSLGQETSFIELDTVEVKRDELCRIEEIVNDLIRKCTPVTVTEYGENNPLPNEVRTRGLPEDHKGDIRVVTIEGLENNMCCGTHVSNLSQLQMIKLVKVEKGKKGKVNLEFLVGGRVLKQFNQMFQREHSLSELLKNPPSVHFELVEKLQKSLKVANKNLKSVLRDFAASESKLLLSQSPKPKFHCLHREDGDMDFINRFIKEVSDEDIFLLVMVGDKKGPGQIVFHGKPHIVSLIGPKVCDLFDGKGAGSGKKFQAKVNNFNKKDEAINIVKEYFDSLQQ